MRFLLSLAIALCIIPNVGIADEACHDALWADLATTEIVTNSHQFQLDFKEAIHRYESSFDSQNADSNADVFIPAYGIFAGGKFNYDTVKHWVKDFRILAQTIGTMFIAVRCQRSPS